jgi:hypothetical protein
LASNEVITTLLEMQSDVMSFDGMVDILEDHLRSSACDQVLRLRNGLKSQVSKEDGSLVAFCYHSMEFALQADYSVLGSGYLLCNVIVVYDDSSVGIVSSLGSGGCVSPNIVSLARVHCEVVGVGRKSSA